MKGRKKHYTYGLLNYVGFSLLVSMGAVRSVSECPFGVLRENLHVEIFARVQKFVACLGSGHCVTEDWRALRVFFLAILLGLA